MPVIGHLFPGITPFNVWQLTLQYWLRYVEAARVQQEAARSQNVIEDPLLRHHRP
jgi:hypothetical protein